MFEDEVMQGHCQGAASACCLLKAVKPGAAADPDIGQKLGWPWPMPPSTGHYPIGPGPARQSQQLVAWSKKTLSDT